MHRDLPRQYFEILNSHLTDGYFRVRHGVEYSEMKEIMEGVPQGSVLGPTLYLLCTRDVPNVNGTMLGTFADDTAILAVEESVEKAVDKLQNAVNNNNLRADFKACVDASGPLMGLHQNIKHENNTDFSEQSTYCVES